MSKRKASDTPPSDSAKTRSGDEKRLPGFLERDAQALYNELWGYPRGTAHFIASTPVSLERRHLGKLSQTHVVAEKNDGERKLLLVGAPENDREIPYIVFVNRSRNITLVARCPDNEIAAETHFLVPGKKKRFDLCDGTLLDGELMPDGTFIVFDCVTAGGYDTKSMAFLERMRVATVCVKALRPFLKCRAKRFYSLDQIDSVLNNASGPCDGLVLMPKSDPVRTGRHDNCFKWKPLHKCTVDLVHSEGKFYTVGEAGKWVDADMDVAGVRLLPPTPSAALVTNMIYEIGPPLEETSSAEQHAQQPNNDAAAAAPRPWRIIGPRPDKIAANYVTTVHRTLLTIRDNIRPEEIR